MKLFARIACRALAILILVGLLDPNHAMLSARPYATCAIITVLLAL